jgi:hypothetical protein
MRLRLAIVLAVVTALAGCGSSAAPRTGSPSPSPSPVFAPAPALVQVENASDARPQWGLQHAAAVYEYLTEGGISRFSAIYTTPPPERIGPVRSARRVTLRLARLYGAVIVYSGASTSVQQALDASDLPHVDEVSSAGDLFRIADRQAPHNLLTDGDHLANLLRRFPGHASQAAPSLWPRATATGQLTPGRGVASFTVPISDSERPTFSYDAAAGGWSRSEPDTGRFVDAASQQPVIAATVVVQQVEVVETGDVEDVNGAPGLDLVVSGSGAAQVFTNGREYDATWSQPASGPPKFALANGSAAPIAPGMVWVCLVATGSSAAVS